MNLAEKQNQLIVANKHFPSVVFWMAFLLVLNSGCTFKSEKNGKKSDNSTRSSAGKKEKKEKWRVITEGDRERARHHQKLAFRFKNAGRTKAYIRELEKASDINPEVFDVEFRLAQYYDTRDDLNRSFKHASKAIELKPDHVESLLIRARAAFLKASLSEKDKYEEGAVADLKRALELDPDNPRVHYCIGVWKSEVGKHKEAIEYYSRAMELGPEQEEYYRFRAMAYTNTKEFDKAIADLTTVLELNPQSWKTRLARAGIYDQLGDYKKALADYDVLTKAGPDLYRARYMRADILVKMKDYKGAIADYNSVLKANNFDDEALKLRADTYMKAKEYEKALLDYNATIDINPELAEYYEKRAECYRKLGKVDKAEADEKQAKKMRKKKAIEKV